MMGDVEDSNSMHFPRTTVGTQENTMSMTIRAIAASMLALSTTAAHGADANRTQLAVSATVIRPVRMTVVDGPINGRGTTLSVAEAENVEISVDHGTVRRTASGLVEIHVDPGRDSVITITY